MIPSLIVVSIIVLFIILSYNGIVKKKNQVKNAFASIDVQLKKRYDLIPNLVSAVKEYMTHERELLTQITELRSKATNPNLSMTDQMKVNQELDQAFHAFNVAVENYPDLKSNENFLHLQKTLLTVEEQLSAARRFYNSAVTIYNNAIMVFPGNIMAGMFGFKQEEVFKVSEQERENVSVKDLFNS